MDWLTDGLTDWLIDGQMDWRTDWLMDGWTDGLMKWLTDWLIDYLTDFICKTFCILTGRLTDACDTELRSEGVCDKMELAPDVVRDKSPVRGIPPLATVSSTSPLVCWRTPIASWCDIPLSSWRPSMAKIWSLSCNRPSLYHRRKEKLSCQKNDQQKEKHEDKSGLLGMNKINMGTVPTWSFIAIQHKPSVTVIFISYYYYFYIAVVLAAVSATPLFMFISGDVVN